MEKTFGKKLSPIFFFPHKYFTDQTKKTNMLNTCQIRNLQTRKRFAFSGLWNVTRDISNSETSPLDGSHRFLSLVKISSLNFILFQSYSPVNKIQNITHRDSSSDLINSKNAVEYVVLATRPWNFAMDKVIPVLDKWRNLVTFKWNMYSLETRIQFITKIAICFNNKCIHRPNHVNFTVQEMIDFLSFVCSFTWLSYNCFTCPCKNCNSPV